MHDVGSWGDWVTVDWAVVSMGRAWAVLRSMMVMR